MNTCTIYEDENNNEIEIHFNKYTSSYFWISLFFFMVMLIVIMSISENVNAVQNYDLSEINYQIYEVEEKDEVENVNFYNPDNNVYNYSSFYEINTDSNNYYLLVDGFFFSFNNTEQFFINGYVNESVNISIHFAYSYFYQSGTDTEIDLMEKNEILEENKTKNYDEWEFLNNWQYSLYYNQDENIRSYYEDSTSQEFYDISSAEAERNQRDIYDDENIYIENIESNFSISIDMVDLSKENEKNNKFLYCFFSTDEDITIKISEYGFTSENEIFNPLETEDYSIYPNNNFDRFFIAKTEKSLNVPLTTTENVFSFTYILKNNEIQTYKETTKYTSSYTANYVMINETFIELDSILIVPGEMTGEYFVQYIDIDNVLKTNYVLSEKNIYIQTKLWKNKINPSGEYEYSIYNYYIVPNSEIESYIGCFLSKEAYIEKSNYTLSEKGKDEIENVESRIKVIDLDERALKDEEIRPEEKDFSNKYQISGDWGMFDSIRKGLNTIISVFESLFSLYFILFGPIYSYMAGMGNIIFEPFDDLINDIGTVLSTIVQDIWDIFEPTISEISETLTLIKTTLINIPDNVFSAFQLALTTIQNAVTAVGVSILAVIEPLLIAIETALSVFSILAPILASLTLIVNSLVDVVLWIVDAIVEIAYFILNFVTFMLDFSILLVEIYYLIGALLILMHIGNGRDYSDSLRLMFDYFIKPIMLILEIIKFIVTIVTSFLP